MSIMEIQKNVPRLAGHRAPDPLEAQSFRVFPLWNADRGNEVVLDDIYADVPDLQSHRSEDALTGIAAVLPSQEVGLETLEYLEMHGLVLVEIPEDLKDATPERLANYLIEQLQPLENVEDFGDTLAMPAPSAPSTRLEQYFVNEPELSAEEEKELLEFLNSSNGVNDGFW